MSECQTDWIRIRRRVARRLNRIQSVFLCTQVYNRGKAVNRLIYSLDKLFEARTTCLCGELLQTAYVDGPLLTGVQVTASNTEVAGRTHHAARQAQRVVREYRLGRTIVVLARTKYQ